VQKFVVFSLNFWVSDSIAKPSRGSGGRFEVISDRPLTFLRGKRNQQWRWRATGQAVGPANWFPLEAEMPFIFFFFYFPACPGFIKIPLWLGASLVTKIIWKSQIITIVFWVILFSFYLFISCDIQWKKPF
jgi:hypothetical protein